MRVRAITPIAVDESEMERRRERYSRLAPEGWQIVLENISEHPRAPRELASESDLEDSQHAVCEIALNEKGEGFDAILPDCVLDTGIEAIEGAVKTPVLGITHLSAHFLAACGRRFGVIVRNETIGAEYERVIHSMGLEHAFGGVFVINLTVEDIADSEKWNSALESAVARAAESDLDLLINGCSAVEVTFKAHGLKVVDPTALALRVAGLAESLGLLESQA